MGQRTHTKHGELLPDIALLSADGRQVRLSDHRGRPNLVLMFAGRGDDGKVLRVLEKIAARYSEFTGEEAEVVVILSKDAASNTRRSNWQFVVLSDGENRTHRAFDTLDRNGTVSPAIFVADRYGEIYAEYCNEERQGLPKTDEILQWLLYVNSQCPECGVPEWPQ